MSKRRALCVGINAFQNYPGSNLNGCVNDAKNMSEVLKRYLGFTSSDIKMLTDGAATKAAIMSELNSMVAGAKNGTYNYLVFSFSSHGTQVADMNRDEPDRFDEAFCPHDLAAKDGRWDQEHIILDDELHALFSKIPDTVLAEVYLDTCHSGTGLKAADLMPDRRPRYIAPPTLELCSELEPLAPRGMAVRLEEKLAKHVILWAACRSNQTSADAYIAGDYHGAFTYYWVKEITAANNDISRKNLLAKVNRDLRAGRFSQVAQLECEATKRDISAPVD